MESRFIDWFVRLPGFVRRAFLWFLFKRPDLIKGYYGTVLVSSIGMFGDGRRLGHSGAKSHAPDYAGQHCAQASLL